MPESHQWPVEHPVFTDCLAQALVDSAKGSGRYETVLNVLSDSDKATAFATRIRFSDSGRCSRQLAYTDIGVVPEVWDTASLHVAFIGTVYHELLQGEIAKRFPGAQVEVKGIVPEANISGHCDAVVDEASMISVLPDWQGGATLFELKSKGTYQFDKSVGIMRKSFKRGDPKGPGLEVILQAGMNARAHNCETVVIGYVCFENFSVNLAAKTGLRQMDRFLAEWHIPKEIWQPLVDREIERLTEVLDTLDNNYLPEREVYDENNWGELTTIAPEATKPAWQCQYCAHRIQCENDGPGIAEIPVSIRSVA